MYAATRGRATALDSPPRAAHARPAGGGWRGRRPPVAMASSARRRWSVEQDLRRQSWPCAGLARPPAVRTQAISGLTIRSLGRRSKLCSSAAPGAGSPPVATALGGLSCGSLSSISAKPSAPISSPRQGEVRDDVLRVRSRVPVFPSGGGPRPRVHGGAAAPADRRARAPAVPTCAALRASQTSPARNDSRGPQPFRPRAALRSPSAK